MITTSVAVKICIISYEALRQQRHFIYGKIYQNLHKELDEVQFIKSALGRAGMDE